MRKTGHEVLFSKNQSKMNQDFSVLISVYRNDNPDYFTKAIYSISSLQTKQPKEIVLVVDGPVSPSLDESIKSIEQEIKSIKVLRLKENVGLGLALQQGLLITSNEIVARMDSDDIAVPNRFEKQLEYLNANPDVAIVGGEIDEFIDDTENIVGRRKVPCLPDEINKYIKSRCPFNHMTVMFRKSQVLSCGNYKPWHFNEDYYLWIRMAEAGCKFANLPETLVNVRVGEEMYRRRGGWKYFKSEAGLQGYMLKHGVISLPRYCFNVIGRFAIQVAMPNKLRGFIFQKLFRK